MNELSIVKREIRKKIDLNLEVGKVLNEMRKIAGERQFDTTQGENSLRRATFNGNLGTLIKNINNFSDDPEQTCASLWRQLEEAGVQSHYFKRQTDAENLRVGVLAEVAAEASLSRLINSCHANPVRDVREGCDLLINPDTTEEICLQIKTTRDSDRRRAPGVSMGMIMKGSKAILDLNYSDEIDIFYHPKTGQPTLLLDKLLLKELKRNHLMN